MESYKGKYKSFFYSSEAYFGNTPLTPPPPPGGTVPSVTPPPLREGDKAWLVIKVLKSINI